MRFSRKKSSTSEHGAPQLPNCQKEGIWLNNVIKECRSLPLEFIRSDKRLEAYMRSAYDKFFDKEPMPEPKPGELEAFAEHLPKRGSPQTLDGKIMNRMVLMMINDEINGIFREGSIPNERESQFSDIIYFAYPEETIAAHLREINGNNFICPPSEMRIVNAIDAIESEQLQKHLKQIKELAERSTFQSVRMAAAKKIQKNQ